jgi:two-component sensor histidine kinase/PAS domain-containing protein
MPALNYTIHDYILICTHNMLLREVIIYMGQVGAYVGVEDDFFQAVCSLDKSCCWQLETVKEGLISVANHLNISRDILRNKVILLINCIYVVKKLELLGICTVADLQKLMKSGINLSSLRIINVMKKPLVILEQDCDVNKTLNMMCLSGVNNSIMVENIGQFMAIVTPENVVLELQKELLRTRNKLQCEMAQRCSLELALKKAEVELKTRVNQATDESGKVNNVLLSQTIDDVWRQDPESPRIKAESQLLQTNSELQEIFQVLPDLYFRLEGDGKILSYHTSKIAEFYLDSAQFIGNHIQDIMPLDVGREFQQGIFRLHQSKSLVAIEYSLLTADGEKSFEARFLPSIRHQIIVIVRNITETKLAHKQAENKLKSSVKEKEVLLKEIHHRVKNNLQVISSLLSLQTRYINDEKVFDIFQDSQNRVRAMAMIHENLYQSNNLAKIEVPDYVKKLTNNLICSYGVEQDVKIHLNIDKVSLKIDTAIPCGLIINELISNALKHAFIKHSRGDIYVNFLDLKNGKYSLSISDTGVGFSKNIEFYKNQSLGLQLVWNLVEQLEGNITFTQIGTVFTIVFVEPN